MACVVMMAPRRAAARPSLQPPLRWPCCCCLHGVPVAAVDCSARVQSFFSPSSLCSRGCLLNACTRGCCPSSLKPSCTQSVPGLHEGRPCWCLSLTTLGISRLGSSLEGTRKSSQVGWPLPEWRGSTYHPEWRSKPANHCVPGAWCLEPVDGGRPAHGTFGGDHGNV